MNLNDMKLGDLLPLVQLLTGQKAGNIGSQYIGKEVILRTYSAGNHFGELVEYDPNIGVAVLKNARRLWKWNTDKGISLSEVALHGIVQGNSKICEGVPDQVVAEVIEVLPVSETASKSIKSAPVYVYN